MRPLSHATVPLARLRGLPLPLAMAGGLALLAGCRANPAPVGAAGTQAVYRLGSLDAVLPPQVPMLTIAAAAEEALLARGYSIVSAEATADRCRVVGLGPQAADYERVIVAGSAAAAGPRVSVHVQPFGDEVASRVIMEALLARLGR